MDLLTLPGVFAPISDSWQLADAVRREPLDPGAAVLDLCTGSGVVALAAAEEGAAVTAVDVSRRAVLTAWLNGHRHGRQIRARHGRTFEPLEGERFDLIASNPPYVPSSGETLPSRGPSRAWVAGTDGRSVLDDIIRGAPDHLNPGGAVLIVHSSLIGEDETVRQMEQAGLVDAHVSERHRGPLGPLMREQQQAGNIPADIAEEDVVIVRARAAS